MSDEKKLSEQVRNCAYIVPDPHPTDTEAGEREVLGLNQVADEIASLEQRLAAAEAERPDYRADELANAVIKQNDLFAEAQARIAELERELAEAKKDAERYRWAVENAIIETSNFKHDGRDPASTKLPLDNAIDAAMLAEREKE